MAEHEDGGVDRVAVERIAGQLAPKSGARRRGWRSDIADKKKALRYQINMSERSWKRAARVSRAALPEVSSALGDGHLSLRACEILCRFGEDGQRTILAVIDRSGLPGRVRANGRLVNKFYRDALRERGHEDLAAVDRVDRELERLAKSWPAESDSAPIVELLERWLRVFRE